MLGMTTALRCGARWRRKECEVTMPKAKSGDSRRAAVREKLRRTQAAPPVKRQALPVVCADPAAGLTSGQVRERERAGYCNTPINPPSKSAKQIVLSNIFTYFNLVFFILAAALIAVGSWRNLTFLFIVFANTGIGIVQELRSKKTLDSLSILSAPKATVIRNGEPFTLDTARTVRDDIVIFQNGNQIFADAEVVEGSCQVNESLITGEADEIKKEPGDQLLSGSFLVSGSCKARLTAVGEDSFVSKLTVEAKKGQHTRKSEMMRSLTKLVKWIGIIVIPFGVVLAVKEVLWLHRDVASGITSTVAALIGMIPEGLYLLTSLALVAGVVRLAQRKTLVHDMECIETLARVDTLCVDKTGTITENKMIVQDIVPLCPERYEASDIRMIMADYVFAMQDDNDTMVALRRYFTGEVRQKAIETMPFTSAKKYGGVSFDAEETYLLGAPEMLLQSRYDEIAPQVEEYASQGCRVLLLALYDGALSDEAVDCGKLFPLSLILLNNKIRANAPETFRYFAEQGVQVKVISGDNPATVANVAMRAGIPDADKAVDARTLTTPAEVKAAALQYTVFGRVTPKQKRMLVDAMKAAGRTVAMTGDGVNDVLALKSADCAVAMASGSDVACQVSDIVLLNSDFSSMPSVVQEGRRVINNIERSAALYLVKNIFSFVLAFITLFATLPYPFTPAQLSLVSALTIGVPSFVLAMEPNKNRVTGHFMRNVITRALPAALTDIVLIVGILLFYVAFKLDVGALSSICTAVMGMVGLLMVHETSKPYNKIRTAMMIFVCVGFVFSFLFLKTFFTISALAWSDALILIVFLALAGPAMRQMHALTDHLGKLLQRVAQAPKKKTRKA